METIVIGIGIFVIVVTLLDFFHTTLSGNGFGFLSEVLNRLLNRLIIQNKNRSIFIYSGLTHLLMNTAVWLILLFLGAYTVFTAGDEMVINGATGLPANSIERFYFTAYILSTLGIGDYIPGNSTSQILAGILSFTGFTLITIGLTYLLSVVQAVLKKKELAFLISTTGKDVEEIYHYFKKEDNLSDLVADTDSLRQQILTNASSYLAFPMVNYFLTKDRDSALIVQLAMMYEVLTVLRMDWEEGTVQEAKIRSIQNAIDRYLELGLEQPNAAHHNSDELNTLRSFWHKHGYVFKKNQYIEKQFSSTLKFSGWSWKDVYEMNKNK
jgi:hypothetical protein